MTEDEARETGRRDAHWVRLELAAAGHPGAPLRLGVGTVPEHLLEAYAEGAGEVLGYRPGVHPLASPGAVEIGVGAPTERTRGFPG